MCIYGKMEVSYKFFIYFCVNLERKSLLSGGDKFLLFHAAIFDSFWCSCWYCKNVAEGSVLLHVAWAANLQ